MDYRQKDWIIPIPYQNMLEGMRFSNSLYKNAILNLESSMR